MLNRTDPNHVICTNLNALSPGFTLAEVLITLGIIGVVAAMTIPTLMNKTNDAELKAGWKKDYSVFSQATIQMASDNGGSLNGLFTSDGDIVDKYAAYVKQSKICADSIVEGCRAAVVQSPNSMGTNGLSDGKGLVLSDGSYFQPWLGETACDQSIGSPIAFYRCAGAVVDVNGAKRPNVFGKDVFVFHILENKLLPYGAQGDNTRNPATSCTDTGDGQGCSAKYLLNN